MSRKIVITGGAGFIGSNLVKHIQTYEPHWKILVLDDLSTGRKENLSGLDVDFFKGSVTDFDLVAEIAHGADHLVHLAAIGSVPRSIDNPRPTHDANITGTLNVLEAARIANVPHTIVASSSSVYGSNPKLPRSESDYTRPLSPYAVSKLATEAYALAYQASYDLGVLALRFFNVYGPRQLATHPYAAVIPKFIHSALTNNQIQVYGDGHQTRDFTFVETVCEVILSSARNRVCSNQPVNLALGSRVSVNQIVENLTELLGRPLLVEYLDARKGDVRDSQADTTVMTAMLPLADATQIRAGLERTIAWFKENELSIR